MVRTLSDHIEKLFILWRSDPSISHLELVHRRRISKQHCLTKWPSCCPFLSLLFLPLVRVREEQNFKNPGMCSMSYFVIKRQSVNHPWRPRSKATRIVYGCSCLTYVRGFITTYSNITYHIALSNERTSKTNSNNYKLQIDEDLDL